MTLTHLRRAELEAQRSVLEKARIKVAAGQRASVAYEGESMTFHRGNLQELNQLLSEINRQLGDTVPRPRGRRVILG